MANTPQESLSKIRESFRTIKTTAERATVKFQEEGKPFLFARDYGSNDESECSAAMFTHYVSNACDFLPNIAKYYANESVIDNIILSPKNEAEKALRDYRLYELSEYGTLNNTCVAMLENKEIGYIFKNNPDEDAIKTVNDQVRLVNSEAYKNYKDIVCKNDAPPPKPKDYSLSREQKRQRIRNTLLNGPEGNEIRKARDAATNGCR